MRTSSEAQGVYVLHHLGRVRKGGVDCWDAMCVVLRPVHAGTAAFPTSKQLAKKEENVYK